jgi:ABC-type glycerol-3-phosphate transport system substrate-binding protein
LPSLTATLTFAVPEQQLSLYQQQVLRFQLEYPTITVRLLSFADLGVPTDTFTNVADLRALLSKADAALLPVIDSDLVRPDVLADLGPLLDASPNLRRGNYYPGTLEQTTFNQQVLALPLSVAAPLIGYNTTLLQLAELELPAPGWTWQDLFRLAEQSVRSTPTGIESYGLADLSGGEVALLGLLTAQGYQPTTAQLQFSDPALVPALNQLRVMVQNGTLLLPSITTTGVPTPTEPLDLIRDGRVALWSGLPADGLLSPEGVPPLFATNVTAQPPATLREPLLGPVYVLSVQSNQRAAAWLWLAFVARQVVVSPGEAVDVTISERLPAHITVAETLGAWKQLDARAADSLRIAVAQNSATARLPNDATRQALLQVIDQLLANPASDPARLLQQAEQQLAAQPPTSPTRVPAAAPPVVADAQRIIFLATAYPTAEAERLAQRFREQYPTINLTVQTSANLTGTLTLERAAQIADCFTWGEPAQTSAEQAALADLNPLLNSEPTLRPDYPRGLLSRYEQQGQQLGMPLALTLRGLGYNQQRFAAAGVALPSGPWSPEAFLQAARQLSSPQAANRVYGYLPQNTEQELLTFIGWLGGRLFESEQPLRVRFSEPATQAAITWFLDLDRREQIAPPLQFAYRRTQAVPATLPISDSFSLISSGQVAIWFDEGQPFSLPGGQMSRLAPFPLGENGVSSTELSSVAFMIATDSPFVQECWQWFQFLNQPDHLASLGGTPARTSLAALPSVAQTAPEQAQLRAAYANALERPWASGRDPVLLAQVELYWFFQAVERGYRQPAELAVALVQAEQQTNAFLACRETSTAAAECARQVDSGYDGFLLGQ